VPRACLRPIGGILAEEAVPRVHRVAAGLAADRDELLDVEVRSRPSARERPSFISLAPVEREGVVLGYAATVRMPDSAAARITRMAISPRLATRRLRMRSLPSRSRALQDGDGFDLDQPVRVRERRDRRQRGGRSFFPKNSSRTATMSARCRTSVR